MLFKNIFRAVKKYYTSLFIKTSEFYSNYKSDKDRRKVVRMHVSDFIQNQILVNEGAEMFGSFYHEQLIEYFGRIVVPKYMPQACNDYFCKKSVDALFKWIYKYNSRNAQKLYSSEIMNRIFKLFLESKNFTEMLETDKTMLKNKELCLEKSNEVLTWFLKTHKTC